MTGWLTGTGGLALLMAGVVLGVVLDVPGGPAGWRAGVTGRRLLLLAVTAGVVAVAAAATWIRLHP